VYVIDGRKLRSMPIEFALKFVGIDFAAGQRHSLKNPLVPECRFLIELFSRAAALAWVLLVGFVVFFSHRQRTRYGESLTSHNYYSDTFRRDATANRAETLFTFSALACPRGA
jgi:hypothetical protein